MFWVQRLKYFLKHWKLGIHLLFRTKRFGVNNKRCSDFDSIFGYPTKTIWKHILTIKPIIKNYKLMRFRAKACYFLDDEEYKLAFGKER